MAYTRRNFVDGSTPAIDADNLNAMDVAIKAHDDRLAALASVDGTSDANKPISTAAAAALALKADLVAGKIPVAQIPSIAMQTPFSAASQTAMLALGAQTGDVCIRSDTKATYILGAMPASTLSNWLLMTVTADPLLPNSNQKAALAGTGSPSSGNPFVTNDTLTNGYGYFHDWNAAKSYGINEPCFYNGIPYKSLVVANINNQPDVSPTSWQVTGGGSGTAGNDIYLSCTFESGLENFAAYADAAGTSPVDGIGGSPVSTVALNTTTPIFGKGDLLFTKGANNRQGEGFSKNFTLERGVLGEPAELSFLYSAGANYLDGYATVSIFDVTNNVFCPVSMPNLPATFGSIARYIATFSPANNSTSYRLIVHVATATLTAWNLEIDNVTIGKKSVQTGAVVSPWVDYAAGSYTFPAGAKSFAAGKCPIGSAGTTNPTKANTTIEDHAQWMREGQDMLVRMDYKQTAAGSAGSGIYLFALPAGYTIDLTKNPVGSIIGNGKVSTSADEVSNYTCTVVSRVYDKSNIQIDIVSVNSSTDLLLQLGLNPTHMLSVSLIVYRLNARFTCAQFSVNSTFVGVNEPFYLSNSESTINTNGVVAKTKLGIDGSPILALTAATYFDMTLPRSLLPNETIILQFRSKANGTWVDGNYAGVDSLYLMSLMGGLVTVTAGNYIRGCVVTQPSSGKVRVRFPSLITTPNGSWESSSGGTDRTWSSIIAAADGYDAWRVRIGQASTGAEIAPTVYMSATNNPAASANSPVLFSTIEHDTYGNTYNPATGRFTAPITGRYRVSANVVLSAVGTSYLYKGDVPFRLGSTGGTDYTTVVASDIVLTKNEYIDIRANVAVKANTLGSFQVSYVGSI